MKKEEAIIKKESLLKEIEELEKIINTPEITAEQRLLKLFGGCVIDTELKKGSVIFFKGNDWRFEIRNSIIWCRYEHVWLVLKEEYLLTDKEIQVLIIKVLEEAFKINGLTPHNHQYLSDHTLEEAFKINGLTPRA
jgi:hypothetical protein